MQLKGLVLLATFASAAPRKEKPRCGRVTATTTLSNIVNTSSVQGTTSLPFLNNSTTTIATTSTESGGAVYPTYSSQSPNSETHSASTSSYSGSTGYHLTSPISLYVTTPSVTNSETQSTSYQILNTSSSTPTPVLATSANYPVLSNTISSISSIDTSSSSTSSSTITTSPEYITLSSTISSTSTTETSSSASSTPTATVSETASSTESTSTTSSYSSTLTDSTFTTASSTSSTSTSIETSTTPSDTSSPEATSSTETSSSTSTFSSSSSTESILVPTPTPTPAPTPTPTPTFYLKASGVVKGTGSQKILLIRSNDKYAELYSTGNSAGSEILTFADTDPAPPATLFYLDDESHLVNAADGFILNTYESAKSNQLYWDANPTGGGWAPPTCQVNVDSTLTCSIGVMNQFSICYGSSGTSLGSNGVLYLTGSAPDQGSNCRGVTVNVVYA
ncbi:uncharacterized protein F4822DRAFT_102841 [Hypoxylon trugodes]|uniref:uncharacterized protein n=1 Tax=Hypoxylon trugodes TaxID=326681 RepID=UPI0021920961|nr:uncharacterized protein F4822DRAFT_102841 [Hypoxylon trugodes]KAI1382693.1 hypothetical protein F4822DRAFT_102841 [Hypoxylon trugodes]